MKIETRNAIVIVSFVGVVFGISVMLFFALGLTVALYIGLLLAFMGIALYIAMTTCVRSPKAVAEGIKVQELKKIIDRFLRLIQQISDSDIEMAFDVDLNGTKFELDEVKKALQKVGCVFVLNREGEILRVKYKNNAIKKATLSEIRKLAEDIDNIEIRFFKYEQIIAAKERPLTFEKEEYEIEEEREALEDKRLGLTKRMRARFTDDKMDEFQNAEDLEKFLQELDKDRVIRENEMIELKRIFEESREDRAFARESILKRIESRHELDMDMERQLHKLEMERKVHELELEKECKEAELDRIEAEQGIELLKEMKAAKREDVIEYQKIAEAIEYFKAQEWEQKAKWIKKDTSKREKYTKAKLPEIKDILIKDSVVQRSELSFDKQVEERFVEAKTRQKMVVKKPEKVNVSIRKEKVEKPPEEGISVGETPVPVEFKVPKGKPIGKLTEEEKKEIKPAILDVVLYTAGFDVSPKEKTRRIELFPWTAETKTEFEVIPTEEGAKAISLLILQEGTRLLGDIQLKVEVLEELPTEVEDASASLSCKLKEFDPTQPDAILDIFHVVQSEEKDEYEFRLFAYEPYLPIVPKPIKRIINRSEKKEIHNLLKAISEFQIYLRGVEGPEEPGKILYNYIPSEIREELKRIKPKNILIITDDSEIPWEYAFDGEDFWCMKYNIGKLLRDEIRYHAVRECPVWGIKNIAIACSNPYNDLKYAKEEVEEIRRLSKFGKCFENEKIDRISFKLLFLKEIGIFHYIGHCKIEEEPQIILCENEYFTSQEIEEQFDALNKLCPLVVLNSCYGGYLGKELDGFARGFIKAGARAFIGPVFGITDKEAFVFATKFYSFLYSGKTLGEALIETRKELKKHGMAWASYTLYGYPTLRPSFA